MLANLAPPCSPHCSPFDRGPAPGALAAASPTSNRRPIPAPAPAPTPIVRPPTFVTRRHFQARKRPGPPSLIDRAKCRGGMGDGIGMGCLWAVAIVSLHRSSFASLGRAASDHRLPSKILFLSILPLGRGRCVRLVACKSRNDPGATENCAWNLNIEQRDNISGSCDSIATSNDREFENGTIGRLPEAVATSGSKNQTIPTLTYESGREQLMENVRPTRSFDELGTLKATENRSGAFDDSDDNGSFLQSSDEADYIQKIDYNSASKGAVEEQASGLDRRIADKSIRENMKSQNTTTLGRITSGQSLNSLVETVSIAGKEPIYEVLEVNQIGVAVTKSVSRRQLLKSSGLRLRDIRSVDPSLWVTTAMPALLIRDQAILLNLGSLRAIATPQNILLFDHKSIGAQMFLELLQQRLNPETSGCVPTMPFELEVVETALLSRTQRLERRLMEVEPRVLSLLEVLPNCLTANVLEELRLSKQALVELGSRTGSLRQMLLELLEDPHEIRRMTVMGRRCIIRKDDGSVECLVSEDKISADDEEEEIEMLLENYLQRCESCHGQAERLLDSAKEMEDSIAVNLSSRRLEVSRLELLLQVGTFCSALGALIAGIFGMNLKSYLEECALAFWLTTAGIVLGGVVLFFIMYNYLRRRKIL